jgi:hypothetical protein
MMARELWSIPKIFGLLTKKELIALYALLAFALILSAQSVSLTPVSLPDATGDAASHQVASSGTARTVSICALTANTAAVRIGDSTITASRGLPLTAGLCAYYPETTGAGDGGGQIRTARWSLAGIYYLAATGDKVSVSYVP